MHVHISIIGFEQQTNDCVVAAVFIKTMFYNVMILNTHYYKEKNSVCPKHYISSCIQVYMKTMQGLYYFEQKCYYCTIQMYTKLYVDSYDSNECIMQTQMFMIFL
jgi:hypothetical protein